MKNSALRNKAKPHSLRDVLRKSKLSALKQKLEAEKQLSSRLKFQKAVRLVIEYKEWIGEDLLDQLGDDVISNVQFAKRKKDDEQVFNIKDRSILLIPPAYRTREEVAYVEVLLRNINAYKKYSPEVRDLLAIECRYQYLPAGRTVIREGHQPRYLYFVVKGVLQILKNVTDEDTDEVRPTEIGELNAGDMFGEIALLHKIPRSATVVTKTSVELLYLERSTFNRILKNVLLEEWDMLRDVLLNFNYFKGWNESLMRECCILSKVMNYQVDDILLGDGIGMIHYVYFIISGECKLIEHMLVEKYHQRNKTKYRLYDGRIVEKNPVQQVGRSVKADVTRDDDIKALILEKSSSVVQQDQDLEGNDPEAYIKMLTKKKATTTMDHISVVTVTLQDVINEWHEITDVVEMLIRQPSTASMQKYPPNVQTVFMQICNFFRGACFGLGEQMRNRRIIATSPVKCLLIPRFWLTKHNRADIWDRVKIFMDSKLPNKESLLQKYISDKQWTKYRRGYSEHLIKNGRKIPNDTKLSDVPYSIRINNIMD